MVPLSLYHNLESKLFKLKIFLKNFNNKIAEPHSNIAGKVSKERFEGNYFFANGPAVLLCPGQGFPIPKYE